MEPWQNWAAILTVTGVAAAYYSQSGKDTNKRKPIKPTTTLEAAKTVPARSKPGKGPKASNDTPSISGHFDDEVTASGSSTHKQGKKQKQKKGKTSHQPKPASSEASGLSSKDDEPEAESNDQEWARLLSKNREGVQLSVPERNQRQRSPRRQKNAAATEEQWSENAEPMDSSAGPAHGALPGAAATAGDVSDMLEESSTTAASVLRITGEDKPTKSRAPQAPTAAQETKKQRQNKQKADDKKRAREQEEKDRKVMEERQRRTAREARGEPARDGLGLTSAPSTSAWAQSPKVNGTATETQASNTNAAPLLDTFDPDEVSTGSSNEQPSNSTPPSTTASTQEQDVREEAQTSMLNQRNGDAGWEMPKSKKGKKQALNRTASPENPRQDTASKPISQFSGTSTNDLTRGQPKTPNPKSQNISSSNGFAALDAATAYQPTNENHPHDSDWAVE